MNLDQCKLIKKDICNLPTAMLQGRREFFKNSLQELIYRFSSLTKEKPTSNIIRIMELVGTCNCNIGIYVFRNKT